MLLFKKKVFVSLPLYKRFADNNAPIYCLSNTLFVQRPFIFHCEWTDSFLTYFMKIFLDYMIFVVEETVNIPTTPTDAIKFLPGMSIHIYVTLNILYIFWIISSFATSSPNFVTLILHKYTVSLSRSYKKVSCSRPFFRSSLSHESSHVCKKSNRIWLLFSVNLSLLTFRPSQEP